MKKSVLCVALLGAMLTGCAVPIEVHQHQASELEALGAYHKAEKQAVKADRIRKVAAGALIAAEAEKILAIHEMEQAKAALDQALEKKEKEND